MFEAVVIVIIVNMKVTVIEMKHYHLKNILIKLDQTEKLSKMILSILAIYLISPKENDEDKTV